MAKRKDLRLDTTGDLFINTSSGDFDIIESDGQHVNDILQSVNGDYKEFPLIGVNFFKYQNSSGQRQEIERIIRTQLLSDGYKVDKIEMPESVTSIQDITVYTNGVEI